MIVCGLSFVFVQIFMRDAKQTEVLLSQQDNYLAKEELPVSFIFGNSFCFYNSFVVHSESSEKVSNQ